MNYLLLIIFMTAVGHNLCAETVRSSNAGGDWYSAGSWNNGTPGEDDYVYIASPVTLSSGIVSVASLQMPSGHKSGSLIIKPGAVVSVDRTVYIRSLGMTNELLVVEGSFYTHSGFTIRGGCRIRVDGGFMGSVFKNTLSMAGTDSKNRAELLVCNGGALQADALYMVNSELVISDASAQVRRVTFGYGSRISITRGALYVRWWPRQSNVSLIELGEGAAFALKGAWDPASLSTGNMAKLKLRSGGMDITFKDLTYRSVRREGDLYTVMEYPGKGDKTVIKSAH